VPGMESFLTPINEKPPEIKPVFHPGRLSQEKIEELLSNHNEETKLMKMTFDDLKDKLARNFNRKPKA